MKCTKCTFGGTTSEIPMYQPATVNRMHFLYNEHLGSQAADYKRGKGCHGEVTGITSTSHFYKPGYLAKMKNDCDATVLLDKLNQILLRSPYVKTEVSLNRENRARHCKTILSSPARNAPVLNFADLPCKATSSNLQFLISDTGQRLLNPSMRPTHSDSANMLEGVEKQPNGSLYNQDFVFHKTTGSNSAPAAMLGLIENTPHPVFGFPDAFCQEQQWGRRALNVKKQQNTQQPTFSPSTSSSSLAISRKKVPRVFATTYSSSFRSMAEETDAPLSDHGNAKNIKICSDTQCLPTICPTKGQNRGNSAPVGKSRDLH